MKTDVVAEKRASPQAKRVWTGDYPVRLQVGDRIIIDKDTSAHTATLVYYDLTEGSQEVHFQTDTEDFNELQEVPWSDDVR